MMHGRQGIYQSSSNKRNEYTVLPVSRDDVNGDSLHPAEPAGGGAIRKNLRRAPAATLATTAVATTAVAFPWVRSKISPLSVCHANTYNVPPFALVHPKFPTEPKNNWKITEEADHINLWFKVEEETRKDELEVAINGNVLLIRYKGKTDNPTSPPSPASSLDVRLLLPTGYENPKTVEAELTFGALLVTVAKPKSSNIPIPIRTSD